MHAIRYFLEVVRAGSIREASARLNVVPSALSRHIQNLEQQVGMPLFERQPRGMTLTAAGRIYAQYARAISLETDRFRGEIEDLRGLRRGIVRVATIEGAVAETLANAVTAFRKRYDGIRFSVLATGTDEVVAAVRDGHADVGVSFYAQPDPAVRFVRRVRNPLLMMVHPDHALASRPRVALAETFGFPMAVPAAGFGIRRLIDDQCRRLGRSLEPALETNSIEALRAFARSNAGLTLLPGMSFQRELRQGEVVAIPIVDRALNQCSIDITILAGRRLPVPVSEFLAVLDHGLLSDTKRGLLSAPSARRQAYRKVAGRSHSGADARSDSTVR